MPSLRAQLGSEADSTTGDPDELRIADALSERAPVREAKPDGLPPRRPLVLAFAVAMAGLWAGGASAYLAGYFRAQNAAGFGWDAQLIGFAVIMAFLPPLLFIARALHTDPGGGDGPVRDASCRNIRRLTAVDETATQNAQRSAVPSAANSMRSPPGWMGYLGACALWNRVGRPCRAA
jgi:hypothetical protein